MMNRRQFLGTCVAAAVLPRVGVAGEPGVGLMGWEKTLYIMDTWFWQETEMKIPAQVALLKQLGFGGMSLAWGVKHAERLAALKENGLGMAGCYVTVDIDGGYPDSLRQSVALIKGTGGPIWLALTSKKHGKSDAAGDEAALAIINRCADECKKGDVAGVVLYPHVSFWMEKVGDAVRLCSKAKRAEVGMQFNQYHWMTADGGQDLRGKLGAALPFLKGVSINGSNAKPSILPLSEGEYDLTPILKALIDLKYSGPISHQGYSIKGDLPRRLAASKQAWEELKRKARAL